MSLSLRPPIEYASLAGTPSMIHDHVSQVVSNIEGSLATPLKAKPKHRVSSAAYRHYRLWRECRTDGLMALGETHDGLR